MRKEAGGMGCIVWGFEEGGRRLLVRNGEIEDWDGLGISN